MNQPSFIYNRLTVDIHPFWGSVTYRDPEDGNRIYTKEEIISEIYDISIGEYTFSEDVQTAYQAAPHLLRKDWKTFTSELFACSNQLFLLEEKTKAAKENANIWVKIVYAIQKLWFSCFPKDDSEIQEKIATIEENIRHYWPVPDEIKEAFTPLFEETPFSMDTLPLYPLIFTKFADSDNAAAPLMKICAQDNRNGLMFTLTQVTENEEEEVTKSFILAEYHSQHAKPYYWIQSFESGGPKFFETPASTILFDYSSNTLPVIGAQHEQSIEEMRKILNGGIGTDSKGVSWKLAEL